jgi:hypothetical protein
MFAPEMWLLGVPDSRTEQERRKLTDASAQKYNNRVSLELPVPRLG